MQTNYDREYPDPAHDPRRVPVEERLLAQGNQGFTKETLMEEYMSIWPTFNIGSVMSSIMVVADGYHNTTVWYGHNPV